MTNARGGKSLGWLTTWENLIYEFPLYLFVLAVFCVTSSFLT